MPQPRHRAIALARTAGLAWVLCGLAAAAGCPDTLGSLPADAGAEALPLRGGAGVRDLAVTHSRDAAWEERMARWRRLHPRPADLTDARRRAPEFERAGNHREAMEAFTALLLAAPADAEALGWAEAVLRTAAAMGAHDAGLQRVEDLLWAMPDALAQARTHRALARAWLAAPHWGVHRAGRFVRAEYSPGAPARSHAQDRSAALAHLEAARQLLAVPVGARATAEQTTERVDTLLELARALVRFTELDPDWRHFWSALQTADLTSEDLEDRDTGSGASAQWQGDAPARTRPRGLPPGPDGRPRFEPRPATYGAATSDVARLKHALNEAAQLGEALPDKRLAARALLLQALAFRTRDGVERLWRLADWWWQGAQPYRAAVEGARLAELGDDEVLGLVGTHLAVFKVPEDENVPRLLRAVAERHPTTDEADEAQALLGAWHQARGQLGRAARAYEDALRGRVAPARADRVKAALEGLRKPEVQLVTSGPAVVGRPAPVRLRVRNVDGLRMTATRLDDERLLEDFRVRWRSASPPAADVAAPEETLLRVVRGDAALRVQVATTDVRVVPLRPARPNQVDAQDINVLVGLDAPGPWLLEVSSGVEAEPLTRALVWVEEHAWLQLPGAGGQRALMLSPRDGRPLAGLTAEAWEYWVALEGDAQVRQLRVHTGLTDARGLAPLPLLEHPAVMVVRDARGRARLLGSLAVQARRKPRPERRVDVTLQWVSDVVAPGGTVMGAAVLGEAVSQARALTLRLRDARGSAWLEAPLPTGRRALPLHLAVPLGAPPGMATLEMEADGVALDVDAPLLRVARPAPVGARLRLEGARLAPVTEHTSITLVAADQGRGPLSGAAVRYRALRTPLVLPEEFPEADARELHARTAWSFLPWWDEAPDRALSAVEVVTEGEGTLGPDGRLPLDLPPPPRSDKLDSRVDLHAEVEWAPGQWQGLAARVVQSHAQSQPVVMAPAYVPPGLEVQAWVCLRHGAQCGGTGRVRMTVDELAWKAQGATLPREVRLHESLLAIPAGPPEAWRWKPPHAGVFRVTASAPDPWTPDARHAVLVVVGQPAAVGRLPALELRADAEHVRVGQVLHLVAVTDAADAAVVLSVRGPQGDVVLEDVLLGPQRFRAVDVTVADNAYPALRVDAVTVAGGQVVRDHLDLPVHPAGFPDVAAQPTEQGFVLDVHSPAGAPVAADVLGQVEPWPLSKEVPVTQPSAVPAQSNLWRAPPGVERSPTDESAVDWLVGASIRLLVPQADAASSRAAPRARRVAEASGAAADVSPAVTWDAWDAHDLALQAALRSTALTPSRTDARGELAVTLEPTGATQRLRALVVTSAGQVVPVRRPLPPRTQAGLELAAPVVLRVGDRAVVEAQLPAPMESTGIRWALAEPDGALAAEGLWAGRVDVPAGVIRTVAARVRAVSAGNPTLLLDATAWGRTVRASRPVSVLLEPSQTRAQAAVSSTDGPDGTQLRMAVQGGTHAGARLWWGASASDAAMQAWEGLAEEPPTAPVLTGRLHVLVALVRASRTDQGVHEPTAEEPAQDDAVTKVEDDGAAGDEAVAGPAPVPATAQWAQADRARALGAALVRALADLQGADGLVSAAPLTPADVLTSARAAWALQDARRAGWAAEVAPVLGPAVDALEGAAEDALRRMAEGLPPLDSDALTAWVLARADDENNADRLLDVLWDQRTLLSPRGRLWLALGLHVLDPDEVRAQRVLSEVLEGAVRPSPDGRALVLGALEGTPEAVEAQAAWLVLLDSGDPEGDAPSAPGVARGLLMMRTSGTQWATPVATQAAAVALALHDATPLSQRRVTAPLVTVNGTTLRSPVRVGNGSYRWDVPAPAAPGGMVSVAVDSAGAHPESHAVWVEDAPPPTSPPTLERLLFRAEGPESQVPLREPARLRVGDLVRVEVRMAAPLAPGLPLLVTDAVPGAWVVVGQPQGLEGAVAAVPAGPGRQVFMVVAGGRPGEVILRYQARVAFGGTYAWPGVQAWVGHDVRARLWGLPTQLTVEAAR